MFEDLHGRKPGMIDEEQYRKYAVLIPLINTADGYDVLFEVRSSKLRHQPREICFPGGRMEAGESSQVAAVRETMEELLLPKENISVIAPMDIFISPFNMILYPYLGELHKYQGSFGKSEVAEVFRVPLSYFLENDPETYYHQVLGQPSKDFPYDRIPDGSKYRWAMGKYEVDFYHYEGREIWGMTAKIMKSAASILKKS